MPSDLAAGPPRHFQRDHCLCQALLCSEHFVGLRTFISAHERHCFCLRLCSQGYLYL